MGAKTWMLVYCDWDAGGILQAKPKLDRTATATFVKKLFPNERLQQLADETLAFTCPPDDELVAGCFPGLSIIAAKELALGLPSTLGASFLEPAFGRNVYLHVMYSGIDWFAFAIWRDGQLQRALSLSPDSDVLEDFGARLAFELPFWGGQFPADPDDDESGYPLPFHPLELGEAALLALFGYQLEGTREVWHLDPDEIALMRFRRMSL
jgi:hypothetical protein